MPKPPTPKSNYRQEAIVINRMINTLEVDTTSPDKWKAETIAKLTEVMRLFMEHSLFKPAAVRK